MFVLPFNQTNIELIQGFGVGVVMTHRTQRRCVADLQTPAQQTFFSYRSDVVADGKRVRVVPRGYYLRSLGILGEYTMNSEQFKRAGTESDVDSSAWLPEVSCFLTGEAAATRP